MLSEVKSHLWVCSIKGFYIHLQSNLRKRPPPNSDHVSTATTIFGRIFLVYSINVPLNNNHLSTMTTIFGSRGWPLYTGLTVLSIE
jgi:hypothetical protein